MALRVIGALKLAKALVLLAAGLAARHIVQGDVASAAGAWAHELHLDPDGRMAHTLLARLTAVPPTRLHVLSLGLFGYAALMALEGLGLLLRRRWAEYVTVLITGSFLPLEAYELFRRTTPLRLGVLVLNLAIVVYLVRRIVRERAMRAAPQG